MTVRIATLADQDEIVALCRLNHAENGDHPLNEDKVAALVGRALARNGGLIGVVGNPGAIVAMIIILIDPVWYSDDLQLLELMNFVHPEARKSTFAKDMIEFAKKCSDETCLDLTIGVLSNIRMEAKVRLYSRQLPKAGEFFVYHPNGNATAPVATQS